MTIDVNYILGSSSPRRKELLGSLGISFEVVKPGFEEVLGDNEKASEYVVRNAVGKVNWIVEHELDAKHPEQSQRTLVIGADTVVVMNEVILQKPKSEDEAREMLEQLSGNSHHVLSGVCIADYKNIDEVCFYQWYSKTEVVFKELSPEEINKYIATGEPMDKAGAYGIQHLGAYLVKEINGSYTNVVGLPLTQLWESLQQILSSEPA